MAYRTDNGLINHVDDCVSQEMRPSGGSECGLSEFLNEDADAVYSFDVRNACYLMVT